MEGQELQKVKYIMKYRVKSITEQGSVKASEDRYLIKDSVFAVFDGATDVSGKDLSIYEMSPGEFAAEMLLKSLEKTADIGEALRQANAKIDDGIRLFFAEPTKQDRFTATATVVRLNDNRLEYWNVSDSYFFLINKMGKVVLPFEPYDQERELLAELRRRLAVKEIEDPIDELRELILARKNDVNKVFGGFNGEPEVFNFIKKGSVDLTDIASVLLFSDGMMYPQKDPNSPTDYQAMADLYLEGGVELMLDTVRELEESDSDFKKYPRFKMHDDATVVAIDLL